MAGQKKTDRKFIGELYPDDKLLDYEAVLEIVQKFPKWAWIIHDKDIKDKETGELKKPHIHFIVEQDTPTTLSAIANKLGVRDNYLQFCRNFRSQMRYLIHADDPEKFQYNPEEVQTNLSKSKYFSGVSDVQKAQHIFNFIMQEECTSPSKLVSWACETGNWSELRRGYSIWAAVMKEMETYKK